MLVASACGGGGEGGASVALTSTTTAPEGPRNPALWPFSSDSPWNTPIGSKATFRSVGAADTVSLLDSRIEFWVNAQEYSHPIVQAAQSDPLVRVRYERTNRGPLVAGSVEIRVPAAATPAAGADGHLHVLDPNGRTAHEFFSFRRTADGATSSYYVASDLTGPGILEGGTRAYGGSALGGLIRRWELEAGQIRHVLALALTGGQLQRGPVWPADEEDATAHATYSGLVPLGTLLAIPVTVDIGGLALSPAGRAVAVALQNFGAYVVDQATVMTFYAEPTVPKDQIEAIRADLPRIRRELRIVSNNGPNSVGGGGRPLVSPAPPLS